ncbi:hypothetical protein D3C78_720020 [compost metagenome]
MLDLGNLTQPWGRDRVGEGGGGQQFDAPVVRDHVGEGQPQLHVAVDIQLARTQNIVTAGLRGDEGQTTTNQNITGLMGHGGRGSEGGCDQQRQDLFHHVFPFLFSFYVVSPKTIKGCE